jgi:hypothetical protein
MEEVPLIKELHQKYSKDVEILGISVDTHVERVDVVVKDKGMTWPVLADGKGFDGPNPTLYHVQGTPDLFILDRAGRIFARLTSAKQLETKLLEALAAR